MLILDSWDFSDTYINVKGTVTVEGDNDDKTRNKNLIFKNIAPFWSCISKINNTYVDNAEDLDIVMPMYNLFEYSDNYPLTSGSLWNYHRDEMNDDENENDNANSRINNKETITSKSSEHETKIIGRTSVDDDTLDTEIVFSLKYLSNFWIFLDLLLINCKIDVKLSW